MQRSEVFKATAGSCRVVADTRATYQQAAIESAPRDAFVSPTVLLTLSVTILHPPRAHRRRARAAADNEAYDAQELERDTLEAGPRVEALSASELGPSGIVRAIKVYIEHNAAALCLRPSVELVQDEPGDVSALRRQGCDKARAVTLKLSSAAPQWASDTTQSFLTSADTHITWNGPRRRRPDRDLKQSLCRPTLGPVDASAIHRLLEQVLLRFVSACPSGRFCAPYIERLETVLPALSFVATPFDRLVAKAKERNEDGPLFRAIATLKQNLPQAFQSNGGRSATIRVLQPVRAEVPFKRTRSQDAGSRHPKLLLRRVATCRAFRQTRTVRRPATSRSRSRAPPSLALAVIPRRDSAAAIRNGLLAALRKRDHQAFPPSSFHLRLRRPRLGSEPSVRSSPPVAQHQEQDGGDIVDDLHSKQAPSHQNIVPNEPVRVRQTQCSSEDADADALPDRLEPLPTRRRGREPETRINNRDGAAFTGTSTNGDLDLTFRETNTNVSLPCAAAYASGQLVASPEAEADDQEDTVLLVEIELDEDQLSQCYPPAVDSAWEINLTNAEQAEVKDTILHIYADDDDIDYDAHGLHLQDPRCEGSTEDGECESEEVAMDIGELDGSIDLLDECILLLMDE